MLKSGLLSDRIQVVDNFLPQPLFDQIQAEVGSANFPWFYNSSNIYGSNSRFIDADADVPYQFTHTLYHEDSGGPNSSAFEMFDPVFNLLGVKELHRAKLNLGPQTSNHVRGGFHYDVMVSDDSFDIMFADWYIGLLYFNSNNGYTEFDDGETVTSVANRLVRFPASRLHTGVSQTDTQVRVVLNVLFK